MTAEESPLLDLAGQPFRRLARSDGRGGVGPNGRGPTIAAFARFTLRRRLHLVIQRARGNLCERDDVGARLLLSRSVAGVDVVAVNPAVNNPRNQGPELL